MDWLFTGSGFTLVAVLIGVIWKDLHRRIAEMSAKFDLSSQAVLSEKVKHLETDYGLLHLWKNSVLPQQFERQNENIINTVRQIEGDLTRRINRLDVETSKAYTGEELRRYLDHMRDDRLRMHEENAARLTRIDNELTRMHARIDEILK